jgi:hypothetical protein
MTNIIMAYEIWQYEKETKAMMDELYVEKDDIALNQLKCCEKLVKLMHSPWYELGINFSCICNLLFLVVTPK